MLTKTERKKIRTQGRVAREKEKQENIKLGLLEPPKPKVKSVPSLPPPPPGRCPSRVREGVGGGSSRCRC